MERLGMRGKATVYPNPTTMWLNWVILGYPYGATEVARVEVVMAAMVETGLVPQLLREVTAALPLAHCVWGLWALCALPNAVVAQEPSPFSHIEYAERRLAAFEASLPAAMLAVGNIKLL